MHIIYQGDHQLSITTLAVGICKICDVGNKVAKFELHCSPNVFVTGAECIKSLNDRQDEFKVEIVVDKYLDGDDHFVTDGEFVIYFRSA